jgi:hypothetical protein
MLRRRALVLAAPGLLLIGAVLVVDVLPLVNCEFCPKVALRSRSIACGIEGVTGIGWIDRLNDFLAGGGTYGWVGHVLRDPQCRVCLGQGRITLVASWTARGSSP